MRSDHLEDCVTEKAIQGQILRKSSYVSGFQNFVKNYVRVRSVEPCLEYRLQKAAAEKICPISPARF